MVMNIKDIEDLIKRKLPNFRDIISKDKEMFDKVQSLISSVGIAFSVNNNLVRGLDYYCHTVFEFKTSEIGSQDTIIGGGRYDGLVKTIGGPDIPGVGWASGIERIVMMLNKIDTKNPLVQVITIDEQSKSYGLNLLISLRKIKIKVRYDHRINIKKSIIF